MVLSYLYLISEGPSGPIKIGHSMDPSDRLRTFQIGNPRPLCIHAAFRLAREDAIFAEREIHEEMEHLAINGEWFDLREEFMDEYMPCFFQALGLEQV